MRKYKVTWNNGTAFMIMDERRFNQFLNQLNNWKYYPVIQLEEA